MTHDFAEARRAMVEEQLRKRGIFDERVLLAMSEVRRELFVSTETMPDAYSDRALPIASGQTISQPYMVALMLQKAQIEPNNNVLEVGTGSGYSAVLLAHLARSIHTIERDAALFQEARKKIGSRVHCHLGDGHRGWPDAAPYDVILVAAAAGSVPRPLIEQLAPNGRMLIPVADRSGQRLIKLTREQGDDVTTEDLGPVVFVPLI